MMNNETFLNHLLADNANLRIQNEENRKRMIENHKSYENLITELRQLQAAYQHKMDENVQLLIENRELRLRCEEYKKPRERSPSISSSESSRRSRSKSPRKTRRSRSRKSRSRSRRRIVVRRRTRSPRSRSPKKSTQETKDLDVENKQDDELIGYFASKLRGVSFRRKVRIVVGVVDNEIAVPIMNKILQRFYYRHYPTICKYMGDCGYSTCKFFHIDLNRLRCSEHPDGNFTFTPYSDMNKRMCEKCAKQETQSSVS